MTSYVICIILFSEYSGEKD